MKAADSKGSAACGRQLTALSLGFSQASAAEGGGLGAGVSPFGGEKPLQGFQLQVPVVRPVPQEGLRGTAEGGGTGVLG